MSATRNIGNASDGEFAPLEPGALATLRDERRDAFDYIASLHLALWAFCEAAIPGASGKLDEVVPRALAKLRAEAEPEAKDDEPRFTKADIDAACEMVRAATLVKIKADDPTARAQARFDFIAARLKDAMDLLPPLAPKNGKRVDPDAAANCVLAAYGRSLMRMDEPCPVTMKATQTDCDHGPYRCHVGDGCECECSMCIQPGEDTRPVGP